MSAAGRPAAQCPRGSGGTLGHSSLIHGHYLSAMCIPLADRLNRSPPVCECSGTPRGLTSELIEFSRNARIPRFPGAECYR
jgi:hypothetical protein